jgi:hypothetical protein
VEPVEVVVNPFILRNLRRRMIENREAAKVGSSYGLAFRGRMAFEKGLSPVECPFPLDSDENRAWCAGWMLAFDKRYGR